ncbi:PucR family transcriptional regulator [Halomonas shantousis]
MPISPGRLSQLMREAATHATQADDVFQAIDKAVLSAIGLADDPVLAARVRRGNRLNLEQWLTRTILEPGRMPAYEPSPEILNAFRENARTGWGEVALEAFRAGETAAWASWMRIVFDLTDDAEEIRAVLEYSHRSISVFVEAAARTIREENARGLADFAEGSPAKRRALVEHLLKGETVNPSHVGRRLGYRLDRQHQALILWSASQAVEPAEMDVWVETIAERCAAAAVLSIVEDPLRRWIWIQRPLSAAEAEAVCPGHARLALGPVLRGLDGFRRSHEGAQIAQRILAKAPENRRVAYYENVRLAAILGQDPAWARAFVSEVLGDLSNAPAPLRDTLRHYLAQGGNVSRTAQALSMHRNTVMRHLALAEELLPRPLADARIEVAAALEALVWWSNE